MERAPSPASFQNNPTSSRGHYQFLGQRNPGQFSEARIFHGLSCVYLHTTKDRRYTKGARMTMTIAIYSNCFFTSGGTFGSEGKSCEYPLNIATVCSARLDPSCTAILCSLVGE